MHVHILIKFVYFGKTFKKVTFYLLFPKNLIDEKLWLKKISNIDVMKECSLLLVKMSNIYYLNTNSLYDIFVPM